MSLSFSVMAWGLGMRNGVGSGNEEWRITAIANPLRSGPGSQGVDGEGPVDIVR